MTNNKLKGNKMKTKLRIVRDRKQVSMFMETQTLTLWQIGKVWYIGIGPDENGHNKIHHHGSERYIRKLWEKVQPAT